VDETINKRYTVTISRQCLGGYKSALKLYYADNNYDFTCPEREQGMQSIDDYLNDQIKSYGNLLAEKKQDGTMPLYEEKSALTDIGFDQLINKFIFYKPPLQTQPAARYSRRHTNWIQGIFGWFWI
jgi:hypothetical protein